MGVVVPEPEAAASPKRRRIRRIAAGALVVVFSITTVAAMIGVWARQTVLDTDEFVHTVRPLPRDEAISLALSEYLTDLLLKEIDLDGRAERALPEDLAFLIGPLDGIVRQYTQQGVREVLRSDRFRRVWANAVRAAHREAIRILRNEEEALVVADGEVTLDLLPIIEEVLQDVLSEGPGFFGNIDLTNLDNDSTRREIRGAVERAFGIELPRDFGQVTVFDEDQLAEAQDAVHLLNEFVVAFVIVALASGAGAIALSLGRRRAVLQLGLGTVIASLLVFTVLRWVIDDVVHTVPEGDNRDAAHAVMTVVVEGLRDRGRFVLTLAIATAVIAYVVGPGRGAVWIRARARWAFGIARDGAISLPGSPAAKWARSNLDPLRVGGAIVAVLALLLVDLSWTVLFVTLVLVAGYELGVTWLARTATTSDKD
jgi:hypothetical protein